MKPFLCLFTNALIDTSPLGFQSTYSGYENLIGNMFPSFITKTEKKVNGQNRNVLESDRGKGCLLSSSKENTVKHSDLYFSLPI
jgi:hypothetical protein